MHAWEPGEPSSSAAGSAVPSSTGIPHCEQPLAAEPEPAAPTQMAQARDLPEQALSSAPERPWASYVPQGLRDMVSSLQKGEGAAGLTQTQALATAAGAVLLLYAGALSFYPAYTVLGMCTCKNCTG